MIVTSRQPRDDKLECTTLLSLIPFLTIVLLAAPPSSAAEIDKDAVVQAVRKRTHVLAEKEKSLQKRAQDVFECSAEGGELVALREAGKVRKILLRSFGESGRARDEYYFDDDGLYFAYRVVEWYDSPLSGKVARTSEERLYFNHGALHAWVQGKTMKPAPAKEWPEKAWQVLNSARQALAGAQLDAKVIHCTTYGEFRAE